MNDEANNQLAEIIRLLRRIAGPEVLIPGAPRPNEQHKPAAYERTRAEMIDEARRVIASTNSQTRPETKEWARRYLVAVGEQP